MASTSVATGAKADRPSFAKIAASGIKAPSTQSTSPRADTQHDNMISSPQDGSNIVSHSSGGPPPQFTPKQKKLVPLMAKEQSAPNGGDTTGPQVSVPDDATTSTIPALSRIAANTGSDEAGSTSSGSGKPPSLDGKSVASGTTYTLDEKESLRPDDSASVKAGEDEEVFPGSGPPGSRMGSEDGTKAFRDQLREISRMDTNRQAEPQPSLARGHSHGGVLYVPPQGSGIGTVPRPSQQETAQDTESDHPPDTKLLEALESPKDRIMVLKLEQDFVDFVKDPKEASLVLPQLNGYHRMLAHRLADYYMLGHIVEDSMAVQIYKTTSCRLAPPLTAVAPPSTAASTPPPAGYQMKILRRGDTVGPTIANGSNAHSKTGSENGESGNDDEKKKYPLSREEREAKYEAARKRIMGSARPSDLPGEAADKDNSRSSSTAPKKTKKKQRNDSDDDFEARSAYSAYYTTPFTSNGATPAAYGFPVNHSQASQFPQQPFAPIQNSNQQYAATANAAWQNQSAFQQQQAAPSPWMPNPPQGYELSSDFQRAMSLQQAGLMPQQQHLPSAWQAQQAQQFGGPQQQWQPQSPYAPGYPAQPAQTQADAFRPSSSSSQVHGQNYAYGQLPSQTFPGRSPNSLEHPLPGSYKGKHFNPQSQTFVPNFGAQYPQATTNMQAFASQIPQASNMPFTSYGSPSLQQQTPFQHPGAFQQTAYHQSSPYQATPLQPQQQSHMMAPQPQQTSNSAGPNRSSPGQPLTHPLPQPVFPRQPSPNMPLPAKPDTTPPKGSQANNGNSPSPGLNSKESSSIAKWGTPSSLPAKPPPSSEPFDVGKFAHNQRGISGGGARVGSGGSGLGQVGAAAGAGSGSSGQTVRRA